MLKGISVNGAAECECELASAKETLGNAEANQRKAFVGIEQGTGKKEKNVLAVMHRGVTGHGKDWSRNNYGTACLFMDEKLHESSVALSNQETPEK